MHSKKNHRFDFDIATIILAVIDICIFAVMVVLYWYIFTKSWNSLKNDSYIAMERAAAYINSEIDSNMGSGVKIATNIELISLLEKDYKNSNEEKLRVGNKISSYMDILSPKLENDGGDFCIYSDNTTLFSTKHLKKMEKLEPASILSELKRKDDKSVLWYRDNNTFTFYQLIATNNYTNVLQVKIPAAKIERFMNGYDRFYLTFDSADNTKNIITAVKLNNGFLLESVIPITERNKILFQNGCIFIMVFLLLTVLFFFISRSIAIAMTRDFYSLIDVINGNNYINNVKNITIGKYREMDIIRNKLVEQLQLIDALHKEADESERKRKIAEIEVTQAKFNPHLLYNTLSVIRWSIMRGSTGEATNILDLLISYYRLVFGGKTVIPLIQEINITQKYVEMMCLARQENIKLTVNISDSLKDFELIKLTLQPLVENSILHGLSKNIEIYAYEHDGVVEIGVKDDGYGISAEKLSELNSNKCTSESLYKNFGIHNTKNRLYLYFGENDFKCVIDSKQNEFTDIKLIISKQKNV